MVSIKTNRLLIFAGIVAEVKLFGDFCFKLGAFGFAEPLYANVVLCYMTTYSIGAQTTQRGSSNPLTTNT
ncbi:unnamed protein product [Prunus armeniaca]